MAFENEIEQYKALPLARRLVFMALIGLIMPAYVFYDENERVAAEITQANLQKSSAEAKLTDAQQKKALLPAKLKELENAKTMLATASNSFASSYDVDEILRKTAGAARDNGVELEAFRPEAPVEAGGLVKYSKQDISISLRGRFVEVTRFLDSLLNLGPLIYLSDINYSQFFKPDAHLGGAVSDKIEDAKERTIIKVSAKMLVFRKVTVN